MLGGRRQCDVAKVVGPMWGSASHTDINGGQDELAPRIAWLVDRLDTCRSDVCHLDLVMACTTRRCGAAGAWGHDTATCRQRGGG